MAALHWEWNEKINLVSRRDASNNPLVTIYAYTPQGQLFQVDYSDDTPDVTYTYNALGQQTSITDGAGTRTFTYNPETLTLNTETFDGAVSGVLHRAYDTYGCLNQVQGDAIPSSLNLGLSSFVLRLSSMGEFPIAILSPPSLVLPTRSLTPTNLTVMF